jgi:hypothetical protein
MIKRIDVKWTETINHYDCWDIEFPDNLDDEQIEQMIKNKVEAYDLELCVSEGDFDEPFITVEDSPEDAEPVFILNCDGELQDSEDF